MTTYYCDELDLLLEHCVFDSDGNLTEGFVINGCWHLKRDDAGRYGAYDAYRLVTDIGKMELCLRKIKHNGDYNETIQAAKGNV
jgi:hypothetical protein